MDAPVIIVGGGPVGLSLSLGLAARKVASIVLERNAEPVQESRALVIWPRTQEIFRDWNAYEALREASSFVTDFTAVNAKTERRMIALDFRLLSDVVDDPGIFVIPQNVTERVLRELVCANPYCDLQTGVEVTSLAQEAQSALVHFERGEARESLRASYVVGCDGAHGLVRHAIGMSLEGITYDSRIVLSDETIEEPLAENSTARIRLDQPGIRLAIRFAEKTWRVIASIEKGQSDEDALLPGAHRERLRTLFGNVFTTTLWSSLFKIHRRHAQRFIIGRVALAGDAAHLNSPAGGQGMNAGIQDAANLAWKIAYALGGRGNGAALFESYDVERREMVTDTIERFTDRLTRVGIGFTPRAKQFVVRAASRVMQGAGMQRKLCRSIGMLGGRYTRSPLVDTRHPLAGRRIDDLVLSDGSRINHRRRGEAALVVAGEFALALPHIHVPLPPKRWHVKPPVVLIVRPDGCVAAVIEKPSIERIESAWNKAFCNAFPLADLAAT
ncbi:MAG: FAD-dependent monooxygenase [Candidatus Aquilonibacter sp.]